MYLNNLSSPRRWGNSTGCQSSLLSQSPPLLGQSPPISYLYNKTRNQYCFMDPQQEDFSFIPSIEINGKKITFTFNQQYALYYDNEFIYSIELALKKFKLPQALDSNLLEKIAIVANYLTDGNTSTYVPESAKQTQNYITFLVENDNKKFERQLVLPLKKTESQLTSNKALV